MSTARDEGLAALQSGDIQTAITRLEAATTEDPTDYDARMYLGGAYGQAEMHMEAIKCFTSAVQLQPANAQARYNLAVAMERGSYRDQAMQVYQQAIQLQPDYPKAKEALGRLQAPSEAGQTGLPDRPVPDAETEQTLNMKLARPTAFERQPAYQPGQQGQAPQPGTPLLWPKAQPAGYDPNAPQPGIDQTQPMQEAPFNPLAPGSPSPSYTPLMQVQPQQNQEPGLGSYMAPPPPQAQRSPFGQGGAPLGARPGAAPFNTFPAYDDQVNIGQAFKDIFRAAFSPRALYAEMAGCESTTSTAGVLILYALFLLVAGAIGGAIKMSTPGAPSLVFSLIGTAIMICVIIVVWLLFALIVQLLSKAFGSTYRYGASFRCVVYAASPYIGAIVALNIITALMPTPNPNMLRGASPPAVLSRVQYNQNSPGSSDPFGQPGSNGANSAGQPGGVSGSTSGAPDASQLMAMLGQMAGMAILVIGVMLTGVIWSIVSLGFAVAGVHELPGGSAAGVAILSALIALVIGIISYVALVAAMIGAVMKMAAGH